MAVWLMILLRDHLANWGHKEMHQKKKKTDEERSHFLKNCQSMLFISLLNLLQFNPCKLKI